VRPSPGETPAKPRRTLPPVGLARAPRTTDATRALAHVCRRYLSKRLKRPAVEKSFCEFGLVCGVVGFLFLFHTGTEASVPPAWQFYAATAAIGVNVAIWFANSEIMFSKVLTWQAATLGEDNLATIIGMYALAGAAGRGFGPIVSSLVMQLSQRGGDGFNCEGITGQPWYNASSVEVCPVPSYYAQQYCCISFTLFCTEGCVLRNSGAFVVFSLLVCVALLALNSRYVRTLTPYERAQTAHSVLSDSQAAATAGAAGDAPKEAAGASDRQSVRLVSDARRRGWVAAAVRGPLAIPATFGLIVALLVSSYTGLLGKRLDALSYRPVAQRGYNFGAEPLTGPHTDVTQTAFGVFAMPRRSPPICMGSRYLQDAERELLRIDAGFPTDKNWNRAPGFMMCTNATGTTYISGGYESQSLDDRRLVCYHDYHSREPWTYRHHTSSYGGKHLKWLLNTSMNNVQVMAFAGIAPTPYGNQSLLTYAHAEYPHLLLGWDVLAAESDGLTRHLYHDTTATSLFTDHPGLMDCGQL
jgi:hypothetical protein